MVTLGEFGDVPELMVSTNDRVLTTQYHPEFMDNSKPFFDWLVNEWIDRAESINPIQNKKMSASDLLWARSSPSNESLRGVGIGSAGLNYTSAASGLNSASQNVVTSLNDFTQAYSTMPVIQEEEGDDNGQGN
jgi:hypothetical protein